MSPKNILCVCALLSAVFLSSTTVAEEEYIFSAPPRETGENETEVYQPIADYLSKATGKKIVYRHSDNWLSYQDGMRKGTYDLVFDGPHFVSWRMAHLKHAPLAKLPGNLAFVVVVRKDNNRINSIKDLAGRSVCGMAPPNLATLTLYNQFDNPARQPLITEVRSFEMAYEGVLPQFFGRYSKDKDLIRTQDAEFRDLLVLLKDSWRF